MENMGSDGQLPECKQEETVVGPCEKYGLDLTKLEVEELFRYRQYRRLYNIVSTDQTRSVYQFRPNLIKQLYFLLQITPFIEEALKRNYLSSIEEWYDSNDHKKVRLSKNIQGMLSNVMKSKNNCSRPKSGVEWDTSLNPFLRPYTAQLRKSNSRARPDSSKYNLKSTCGDSGTKEEQQISEDFTNSPDLCEIEQQWQRSQEFKNNHRTLHPNQEPTYQRLIQLIERAQRGSFTQSTQTHTQMRYSSDAKHKHSPTTANFPLPDFKAKNRSIYSSMIKRENSQLAAQRQLQQNKQQRDEEINEQAEDPTAMDDQGEEVQDQVDEEVDLCTSKRIYTKDTRTAQKCKMYTRVNGMRIVRPFTAKEHHLINRLDHYYQRDNNTNVILSNQDKEFLSKYTQYIKNKTKMRIQTGRKSESKRYLTRATTAQRVTTEQYSDNKQNAINTIIVPAVKSKNIKTTPIGPYYSKKQFFQPRKAIEIKHSLQSVMADRNAVKSSQNIGGKLGGSNRNSLLSVLPSKQNFLSSQRVNLLHHEHLDKYNEQVLEDIEKIKEKLKGKNYASTESLMRALYVDAPPRKQDNFMQPVAGEEQHGSTDCLTGNAAPFSAMDTTPLAVDITPCLTDCKKLDLFDKRHLMVSQGQKKKKVKKRKLYKKGVKK